MKKCNACGSQLQDNYNACPNCGNTNLISDNMMGYGQPQMGQPMGGQQPMGYGQPQMGQPMGQTQVPMGGQPQMGMPGPQMGYNGQMGMQPNYGMPVEDKGNIGWAILGFFIPIVGWILYFSWKNSKPGNAKMAGIGGIAGFCFNLFFQYMIF